jgi:hypothetical protein
MSLLRKILQIFSTQKVREEGISMTVFAFTLAKIERISL